MRAADIEKLLSVGRPAIAPDGSRAVVGVSRPDLDADAVVGQLWEVALNGSTPPRRLTRGRRDASPRFSPDGTLLAFLRASDGPPQLHVVDAGGGEAVALTDRHLGVGDFDWTPDSTAIVYASRVPEEGRYGTLDGVDAGAEPARRITGVRYTANGLGYTIDRRQHLFRVPVVSPGSEPHYRAAPRVGESAAEPTDGIPESVQLTRGDIEHSAPRVSPDGTRVLFTAARHETRETDLRTDLWELPLDGQGEREPIRRSGPAPLDFVDAAYGPDGRIWATAQDLGPDAVDFVARNAALYLIDGERTTRLTDPDEHDLAEVGAAISVVDADTVLIQDRTRGRTPLLRVDSAGGVEVLTPGDVSVSAHAAASGVVVASVALPDSAGELALVTDDGLRLLTDLGAAIRATGLVTPRELSLPGRDGYEVHGWLAVPDGPGPHPVLLNIHGGPFSSYGVELFDETQVYVDAGYAVVYANPRGSAGYGQDHGRVIAQAMGTVDKDDVLAFLDGAVAAHPELDGSRVGILGGSYGGYLTAWTIAHDHRWAGAIVERGFLDPELFIGTSDIGSFFSAAYTGDDPAHRRTQSPQAVVDQVTTPTLVLHSELDLRCPVSQAERYYAALRARGVDTEMVLFPGEDHELSRSGRPRHRLQRFEVILDWWQRHLPVSS